ncbi:MAG: glycosyltransferase [Chitinophagales bacterium]|nr:glycosyltransferase [Chitinophagales bacterium]MBP9548445.1 glycosyltransferase [Chitinophagales bacterium]MBP9796705.1 glycosyltransferase [Chitinophagales bacterium]
MRKSDVIIPVYNSAAILPVLIEKIADSLSNISDEYKIILVDDGSKDNSWSEIKNLKNKYNFILGIKLDKNYGQHQAIRAGLEHANAEWNFVMDCDLQDNPKYLIDLYKKAIADNVEVVLADRQAKTGRIYYKVSSWLINAKLSVLLKKKINYRTANFGIYSNVVISKICSLPYKHFYFPVAVRKCTDSISEFKVMHNDRFAGKSNYNFFRLIALALHAILFVFQTGDKGKPSFHILEMVE